MQQNRDAVFLDSYSMFQIPPKHNQLKGVFSIEHYIVAE